MNRKLLEINNLQQLELHGFNVQKLVQTELSEFPTITRLLVATERSHHVVGTAIDVDLTGAHPASYAFRAVFVAGPYAARKTVDGIVGDAYGIIFVFIRKNRKNRAENFLPHGRRPPVSPEATKIPRAR